MDEVAHTLESMTPVQLVAALVFVSGYVIAIGHLATPRWRAWGGVLASIAAIVFVALTDPWVYGAMLVAMALGGMGLFIGMAWLGSFFAHRWAEKRHGAFVAIEPTFASDAAPLELEVRSPPPPAAIGPAHGQPSLP